MPSGKSAKKLAKKSPGLSPKKSPRISERKSAEKSPGKSPKKSPKKSPGKSSRLSSPERLSSLGRERSAPDYVDSDEEEDFIPFYLEGEIEENEFDAYFEEQSTPWEEEEEGADLGDFDPVVVFTSPPREPKLFDDDVPLKVYVPGEVNYLRAEEPNLWGEYFSLNGNFKIHNPEITHSRSEARTRNSTQDLFFTRAPDFPTDRVPEPPASSLEQDYLSLLEGSGASVPQNLRQPLYLRQLWALLQGRPKEVTLAQLKEFLNEAGVEIPKGKLLKDEAVRLALGAVGLQPAEQAKVN